MRRLNRLPIYAGLLLLLVALRPLSLDYHHAASGTVGRWRAMASSRDRPRILPKPCKRGVGDGIIGEPDPTPVPPAPPVEPREISEPQLMPRSTHKISAAARPAPSSMQQWSRMTGGKSSTGPRRADHARISSSGTGPSAKGGRGTSSPLRIEGNRPGRGPCRHHTAFRVYKTGRP